MLTDIEIAKSVKLRPINEVAAELGIHEDQVENYGRYIAKITTARIDRNKFKNHHLILVTAISPTKAGNGKTTVSVGLALGMQKIVVLQVAGMPRVCLWIRLISISLAISMPSQRPTT